MSWQVSAGTLNSPVVTSTVDVIGVDQPPVLSGAGNTVSYTVGEAAQAVDTTLALGDPDSLDMANATVVITGAFASGDTLNATNLDGGTIAESYNTATGALTLAGADTVAAYQAALELGAVLHHQHKHRGALRGLDRQ